MESARDFLTEPREINFEHSPDFVNILRETGISLLVSTYQAGKLVVLGTNDQGLTVSAINFEKPMGIAVHPNRIAIGGSTHISFLNNTPDLTPQLDPTTQYDTCYLTMGSHFTNDISIHEMAWCHEELWFVNTRFSCLASLDPNYSFVPRWHPSCISQLAAEDRCHLNGFCVDKNAPRYVTLHAETDTPQGWRTDKATGGTLLDVSSGKVVTAGLSMPHSPRIHGNRLWVLESGRGRLLLVDPDSGQAQEVTQQPGYTRGLDFAGRFGFIGLSLIRETAIFGDIPIAERPDELKCAVVIVNLETGKRVASFEFLSGVEEIFDVKVLPSSKNPYISGPLAAAEGAKTIWYAPAPRWLHPQQAGPDQDSPIAAVTAPRITLCKEAFDVFQQGVQQIREDRFVEALESFDQALQLEATFPEALCNRGLVQQLMKQFDESVASFQQSLELAPKEPRTHMNLSMTLFLQQKLAEAWLEYQWRWQSECFEPYPPDIGRLAPEWDGTSLKGKRILVFGEQGIGDEIMFASCLPEVIAAAGSCLIACSPRLIPMFRRSFPAAEVISRYQLPDVGKLDWQVGVGTVASHLRKTPAAFPRQLKFLSAETELIDHWHARLNGLGPGRNIGISWKGGKELDDRRRRSTRLEQWLPVLATKNVQFVNLQYGDCHDELKEIQQKHGITIHDYAEIDPLTDMDGLAALVASLDLVIAVDSTTIHLSGALGIPTWALLSFPSMSYWRWFLPGEETVWYSSMELFRREHPHGWEATFNQIAHRLEDLR